METKRIPITGTPPALLPAFISGFNLIANNAKILLFPILLDLLLWLGPHVRVKTIYDAVLTALPDVAKDLGNPDLVALINENMAYFKDITAHINLLSGLRTLPVGIPSLQFGLSPIETPFGSPLMIEMPDFGTALLVFILTMVVGYFLGTAYFSWISRLTATTQVPFSIKTTIKQALQAISLALILGIALLIILLPLTFVVSILSMISAGVAEAALLIASFFLLWTLMPVLFSMHGIFTHNFNAINSISASVRLVRYFMPGAGFFMIIALILTLGLNAIWSIAPAASWLSVFGIAGHAFISTAIIAASFIYYRGSFQWMQENLQRLAQTNGIKI